MNQIVKCRGCGHRFPINREKHRNRRERYCPRCKYPYKIPGRFDFIPNPL